MCAQNSSKSTHFRHRQEQAICHLFSESPCEVVRQTHLAGNYLCRRGWRQWAPSRGQPGRPLTLTDPRRRLRPALRGWRREGGAVMRWLQRRRWTRVLAETNYELAGLLLVHRFRGGVIPKQLARCLDDYTKAPGLQAAVGLLESDPQLLPFFELARRGGVTDRVFQLRCEQRPGDEAAFRSFPEDISADEVKEAARQMRVETYLEMDRRATGGKQ